MNAPHPLSVGALLCVGATLLTACTKDSVASSPAVAASTSSSALPAVPPPSAIPAATAPPLAIALAPQRFERAKLGFDGLADMKPDLFDWDVGGVFQQGRFLANNDQLLSILVRAHGDETLAGFERDHARDTLSKRSTLQICGRNAEMVRATRPEEHIACVMVAPPGHNHPAYVPPTESTAVAFEHGQLGVVMSVEVVAADPASYRPAVDRIFASIRCF